MRIRTLAYFDLGGDTIFASQTALFDKLSPTFQETFQGLHAVHSSEVWHSVTWRESG
jgi:hypothetical protein